jgi:hypothetical protein
MGLAIMLALVLGVSTTAIGATGGNFILGKSSNAGKQTSLVGNVVDITRSALMIKNGKGEALSSYGWLTLTPQTPP